MSENKQEHPRRAMNSPNNHSHPSRLDQFAGEIPADEGEALDITYNYVPSMEVTSVEREPEDK